MNFMPYLKDPRTKAPSVSLTLLVLSFLALLIASTFHLSGLVQNTSSLTELFAITSSLYFGRRISTKSGDIIDNPTTNNEKGPQ